MNNTDTKKRQETKKEARAARKVLDAVSAVKEKEFNRAIFAMNRAFMCSLHREYQMIVELLLTRADRGLLNAIYNEVDINEELPTPERIEEMAINYGKHWLPAELVCKWRWRESVGVMLRSVDCDLIGARELAKRLGL